jgi:hemolysin secretion/activation protein ShlB/FhaC/HecB
VRSVGVALVLVLAVGFAPLFAHAQLPDSTKRDTTVHTHRRPVRRQPVTPELERTAFADAQARTLLARARAARMSQDSALRAYDAKSYFRLSVGMGVRSLGNKLLLRSEQAARVRWSRESGVWVEPTGRRSAFPMGNADVDFSAATPIPYFPGRETLWIPSSEMGIAQAEVDENDLIHPLATGAEAYYRYATGDSLSFRLPDGKTVAVRELRITARRPAWRAFVGSFWFDVERGSLVRATYRLAADIDMWQEGMDEERQRIDSLRERARTDTGAAARRAARQADSLTPGIRDRILMKLVEGSIRPMRASLSAVTVEYGLYEGRFWLPKLNVAEAQMQLGFVRFPVMWEERFQFNKVNGADPLPAVPAVPPGGTVADTILVAGGRITMGTDGPPSRRDTSLAARTSREDSLVRRYNRQADSVRVLADKYRAGGDSATARRYSREADRYAAYARVILRRRETCKTDSSYVSGTTTRYNGAVRIGVIMPCNESRLANSADLPGSIYDPGEELFGSSERDALLNSLGLSLQPGWGPQRPQFVTGLAFMRYNRVEALSLGGAVTSELGLGYSAQLVGRFGFGDRIPNAELTLARSNGRAELRVGVFKRLAVANDDWGSPLSLGASLSNLLYARDEGFYYRSSGVELSGTVSAPGRIGGGIASWRLFAERQRSAGTEPNTQVSFGDLFGDPRFNTNIAAEALTSVGGSTDWSRTFGLDPRALQFAVRLRAEGAYVRDFARRATGYGRLMFDGTLSRTLGPVAASVTGAAGGAEGHLPSQRQFYLGGLQTVRGQIAVPDVDGHVGDSFWLTRTELGLGSSRAFRPSLFYDAGWAGTPRDSWGRPLSGAGVGLSLLDGFMRFDLARGIWPEHRWRVYASLGARF